MELRVQSSQTGDWRGESCVETDLQRSPDPEYGVDCADGCGETGEGATRADGSKECLLSHWAGNRASFLHSDWKTSYL